MLISKINTNDLVKKITNKNKTTAKTENNNEVYGPYIMQEYTPISTSSSKGGSGSVSYSSSMKPYLNEMIAAYRQGADANKAAAKMAYDNKMRDLKTSLDRAQASYDTGVANANQNYESTRSNLLTSIKRFQEENQRNAENQRKAYLTDQAALESARLESDRQTRIDSAARGLGGSGLQQLAQLQNLINQGQEISNLATSNQSEMDALRRQMTQAQEDHDNDLAAAERARKTTVDNLMTVLNNAKADTTTGEADALATYYAALQGIDADLANKIADANYNFGQNSYSASRSAAASSNAEESKLVQGLYMGAEKRLSNALDSIDGLSDKELRKQYGTKDKNKIKQQLYNDTKNSLVDYLEAYGANYTPYYDTALNNLKAIYVNR